MNFVAICMFSALAIVAGQKDPNYIADRNTIVHLFEWKFEDIGNECERFLQYKGYAGVQVSPVSENIIVANRPWWERYQPISYKIATRSGNEDDFLNMTRRCNDVGIRIYVDAVINHMTGPSDNAIGTGGSKANPSTKDYPEVPYSAWDFHDDCSINDYGDANEVRYCELQGLKDLNQGKDYVQKKIIEYFNKLVDLGVAGFRIDAAKHMHPGDLEYIYSQVKNLNTDFGFKQGARPYFYQEVIDFGGEAISKNEYTKFGDVTEFKFGRELGRVFRGKDKLAFLVNWGPEWGLIGDSNDAFVFIDNHDNQRGHGGGKDDILTYKESKQYKMAIAFMLAHPYGTTRIMSSYDFNESDQGPPQDSQENIISPQINPMDDTCINGWICEHRWRQIYNMIGFRNSVQGTGMANWWSDGNQQIAFSRGNKGFIVFTNGGDIINRTFQTGLPEGRYCDVISGGIAPGTHTCTGHEIKVNNYGWADISLTANGPDGMVAIHAGSLVV